MATSQWDGYHQKKKKRKQMLVSMWRNWSPWCCSWDCQRAQPPWKSYYRIQQFQSCIDNPKELKVRSQRRICTHYHSSTTPNRHKVERTSVHYQKMDKQAVACTYNGILFSLKREGHSGTCYHKDEPQGPLF